MATASVVSMGDARCKCAYIASRVADEKELVLVRMAHLYGRG